MGQAAASNHAEGGIRRTAKGLRRPRASPKQLPQPLAKGIHAQGPNALGALESLAGTYYVTPMQTRTIKTVLAVLVLVAATAGCSGIRSTSRHAAEPGARHGAPPPTTGTDSLSGAFLPLPPDSVAEETEWLIENLAVPIDSLSGAEVPDISDSTAEATRARLPSTEELFDYPVVVNRRVLAWIDAYLGRSRKAFERSLRRSGRYVGMARKIFAEEGVPQDLVFLAHVESGFRYNARSPKRALGLWQFMRGTARLYGLRCDSYVDERLDPEKSTRAAARYLKDLYGEFGDWYLALAAYNAGAGKVRRAIRRARTKDFWKIARTRYLRNETRNFVPAILAATILAKSPGAYGLPEETEPPLSYETVHVDTPTDLRIISRCIDVTVSELQRLNPALLILQTPPGKSGYEVHVPMGKGEQLLAQLSKIPPEKRLVYHRHKVRRGETLGLLARRYGTTVRAIQDANRMGRRTLIRIGQTLLIPSRYWTSADLAEYVWGKGETIRHTVRPGENLALIARHYGTSVKVLQEANGLLNPDRIYAGQVILIPRPKPVTRSPGDSAEETPRPQEQAAKASGLLAQNTTVTAAEDDLGRVPSTVHIVEEARKALASSKPAEPIERPRYHVVRRGETLSEIAAHYGTSVSKLKRWNSIRRADRIYPGQKILLEPPRLAENEVPRRIHVVRRGESLWTIARRYGVSVSDLASWNDIGRSGMIYPGQRLLIYY